MPLHVHIERLQADLEELSAIGRDDASGIHRVAFSDGDMQAREWFIDKLKDAGLDVHVDGAANIFGRLEAKTEGPSVLTGSHLDTVPGAGHLDGALGVVAGLECLRCLKESGASLSHPVEVASFTDEEGRFGQMPGSQAVSGQLTPESILKAQDLSGKTLVEAMRERGMDAMHALRAARSPDSLKAFVELHIEQGPVLDSKGLAIGVVEGIVGLFKWAVRFIGVANHAGTTPMSMRHDAFAGLAEFSNAIPKILEQSGGAASVATIGRVELTPGAANVVPGQADFTLEVRDIDEEVLKNLRNAIRQELSAIGRRRDLMFEFSVLSEISPAPCDESVMNTIESVSSELELSTLRLPSGAAHDTQQLCTITPAGMIFVPSKEGRSHSPAEWTPWESIEAGANVLLNTIARLAG